MKRTVLTVAAGAVAVALSGSIALAGPIFYSGGPTPDPKALEQCKGQEAPGVPASGAWLRISPPGPAPTGAALAPTFASGGPQAWNAPEAATKDATWCGGAYRPEAGTNFGGS